MRPIEQKILDELAELKKEILELKKQPSRVDIHYYYNYPYQFYPYQPYQPYNPWVNMGIGQINWGSTTKAPPTTTNSTSGETPPFQITYSAEIPCTLT